MPRGKPLCQDVDVRNVNPLNDTTPGRPDAVPMQSTTTQEATMKTTATTLYVKAVAVTASLAAIAALAGSLRVK